MITPQRPLVVDCFLYNGEVTLLDVRLRYLSAHVDWFIIAESAQTFNGRSRTPTFKNDIQKIVSEVPGLEKKIRYAFSETLPGDSSWERETASRSSLTPYLTDMPDDTVVMLSDIDEIPCVDIIPKQIDDFRVLNQDLYYYRFNLHCNEIKWHGTRIFPAKFLRQGGTLQEARRKEEGVVVENAGWYLISLQCKLNR